MDPPSSRSRVDQDAHNYSQSQALSVSGESNWTHETTHRDRASLYSYRSRDILNFVREIDGRTFNTTNELYLLPTDQEEWARLNKQHEALSLEFGGLYPSAVAIHEILAPTPGLAKAVLDLGCGTSIWATQMAKDFPHATVIGVDLAPCPLYSESAPENYHFELDNVDLGMSHYFDQFTLVHARGLGIGISDYRKMVVEMLLCLKPGGMLLLTEFDWTLYEEDKATECPVAGDDCPTGSWMQRILKEAKAAASRNGSDFSAMDDVMEAGLWSSQLAEPSSCRTAALFLPILTPVDAPANPPVGSNMILESLMGLLRGLHHLLRVGGIPQAQIDLWSTRADEGTSITFFQPHADTFAELNSFRGTRWIRTNLAWGRRLSSVASPPGDIDQRSGGLPHESPTESRLQGPRSMTPSAGIAASAAPHSYFVVYESQEESMNAAGVNRVAQGGH